MFFYEHIFIVLFFPLPDNTVLHFFFSFHLFNLYSTAVCLFLPPCVSSFTHGLPTSLKYCNFVAHFMLLLIFFFFGFQSLLDMLVCFSQLQGHFMICTFYIVLITGYFLLSDAGGRTPGKIRRDFQTSRYKNHITETQNK